MKRIIALLLMLCLLAGGCMTASADEDDNLPLLSSVEELEAYIRRAIIYMEDDLEFSYTAALDEIFSTREGVNYILESYGARNWYLSRRTLYRTAHLRINSYKPGAHVAHAYLIGDTSMLNDEEKQLYAVGVQILGEALSRTNDELELEKYFHDEICRRVTYKNSGPGNFTPNHATGALLYGEAECDGYADAFYMLCTMAGMDVGYIYGLADASDEDSDHMWNLIELDNGQKYHVDVCWDDDGSAGISYQYFNVGSNDLSGRSWDASLPGVSDTAY